MRAGENAGNDLEDATGSGTAARRMQLLRTDVRFLFLRVFSDLFDLFVW